MSKNGKGAGPETGAPRDSLAGGRRGFHSAHQRPKQSRGRTTSLAPHEVALAMLGDMRAAGVCPCDPGAVMADLAGGGLVRFSCEGDGRGKRNGWARLFCDGRPAGRFGNWRLGVDRTWSANHGPVAVNLADMAARKAEERDAREGRYRQAESEARRLLQASRPAGDHPYLVAKRLEPAAAENMGRQIVVRRDGCDLLVPLETLQIGLCSLQRIAPDGRKLFLPGGRTGGAFWSAGKAEGAPIIAIGEGFATMAAVHLATGLPVAAAMTAHNLEAVTRAFHGRFAAARLILCADMDCGPAGNIGLERANAAAAMVPDALVARPPRPADWPENKGWDFADTWIAPGGPEAICCALGMGGKANG